MSWICRCYYENEDDSVTHCVNCGAAKGEFKEQDDKSKQPPEVHPVLIKSQHIVPIALTIESHRPSSAHPPRFP